MNWLSNVSRHNKFANYILKFVTSYIFWSVKKSKTAVDIAL